MKQRLGDWVVFSAYPGHDFFHNRLFDQIGACDTNGRVLIIAAISKKEFWVKSLDLSGHAIL
jgi:hypothetical protein